ncbi:replication protein C (plasmid) [Bartonella kosoyi]|uniref:Replication protein C n=1 Tax=Bartonella kosoyi TaxID=2133959 RepID=A0A5B9RHL6_9HYPH|nr:plasmid replication protein RepC [Bartonella kosoyi]QEG79281.1 replication protein C [Bartonella kosoyi]
MVNKISGRKLSAHHIEFRKLAENAEMGSVSRGQLIGLVNQLEITGFIREIEAKLLLTLLRTAQRDEFEKGGLPIVFKSNKRLSYEINRSEGRVSRLLSRLYDGGFIVMRDSGNFKRFPVRNHDADIITACGIDLRILVARYHELKQKTDEILEVHKKHEEALKYFKGLLRQIRYSFALIEATPFVSMLFSRMQKIAHIIGRPAKASVGKLHKAIYLLEWILQKFFRQKTSKTTYTYVTGDIHIEHTTPKHICNCNKNECSDHSERTQINNITSGHEKMAYEKIEKSKAGSALPSKNNKSLQIKPELLVEALPNVTMFMKHGLQSERDLIGSMEFFAKMNRISSHAVEEAKKNMGIKRAALAIAIIFEKYCKELVKSPGGYLRGMIAKENRGELYLERSFYALLNKASEEKLKGFCTKKAEKNEQIKPNDQKNSLLRSEFKKVIKTLNMQTASKKIVL